MASPDPEAAAPAAELRALQDRLRGMAGTEPVPDAPAALPGFAENPIPLAQPVAPDTLLAEPLALPVDVPLAQPVAEPEATPSAAPPPCPCCAAPRTPGQSYCGDCGFIFPTDEASPLLAAAPASATTVATRLQERYELLDRLGERGGVEHYRGTDHGAEAVPVSVLIVRAATPPPVETVTAEVLEAPAADARTNEEVLPTFDLSPPAAEPAVAAVVAEPLWPSLAWEKDVLLKAAHPALPRVLDEFSEDGHDYLVFEAPAGQTLWDAWDDPEATSARRYGWLRQGAEALDALHRAGALVEGLRPDAVVVTGDDRVCFGDLSVLLPLPVPADAPIRATHYTAPELVFAKEQADARADLYHFGALLFSLHVGRELTEMDFDRPGVPKDFFPLYPEIHPLIGRLIVKTFCRDVAQRFPTDEAAKEDATGFAELLRTLDTCGRVLDRVRLEAAAWTTTGMVRTGNEDAFALLHGTQAHEDELTDSALVLLCDGMGGYEAGEVAARMTVEALRKALLPQRPFSGILGEVVFALDVGATRRQLEAALKDANRLVYDAARGGVGRRGMGCTAEVVFVHGRHLIVGHVGDSRVYLLHENQLTQLTRDHTLVSRLVELGQLTEDEAATHPRRSELQQAIGGHSDVEIELHSRVLHPGDWVIVCSDGLSNHVLPKTLKEMLLTAGSAEVAARRLVNLTNLEGATDNATVVVLRVT